MPNVSQCPVGHCARPNEPTFFSDFIFGMSEVLLDYNNIFHNRKQKINVLGTKGLRRRADEPNHVGSIPAVVTALQMVAKS